ncbi:flagellar hook-length control protein FliK [Thalassovita sp.]|uniref:flagellar hook-length control protein FliK n=1 Tax=Thalassovita sp. TaxID=1979401 RepID=UPI002B274F24|nr:flagellar hook-length control protein FliK [Thalassovita sp.]
MPQTVTPAPAPGTPTIFLGNVSGIQPSGIEEGQDFAELLQGSQNINSVPGGIAQATDPTALQGKTTLPATELVFQPDNENIQPDQLDLTMTAEGVTADPALLPLDVLSGRPAKTTAGTNQHPATLDQLPPLATLAVAKSDTASIPEQVNPALGTPIATAPDTLMASEAATLSTSAGSDLALAEREPAIEQIATLEAMAPKSLSEPSQAIAPELPPETGEEGKDLKIEITQDQTEEIAKILSRTDPVPDPVQTGSEATIATDAKQAGMVGIPWAAQADPTATQTNPEATETSQPDAPRPDVSALRPKTIAPETLALNQDETASETTVDPEAADIPDATKPATPMAALPGSASDQALAAAAGQVNRAEFVRAGNDKIPAEPGKSTDISSPAMNAAAQAIAAEARQPQTGGQGQGAQPQGGNVAEMADVKSAAETPKNEIRFSIEGTAPGSPGEIGHAKALRPETATQRPELAITTAPAAQAPTDMKSSTSPAPQQLELQTAAGPVQETASETLPHPQHKAEAPAPLPTHNSVQNGEFRGPENSVNTAASNAAFAAPRNLQLVDAEWPGKLTAMVREAHEMGQHEIEIALQPEKLGRMTIKLDMRDGNTVAVNIVTESDAAARMLNDTQSRLADMMQKAGLDLTQHQANSGQGFQNQNGQEGHSDRNSQSGPSQQQAQSAAEASIQSTQTNPDNGIDIIA